MKYSVAVEWSTFSFGVIVKAKSPRMVVLLIGPLIIGLEAA